MSDNPGRDLANMRRQVRGICLWCGSTFEGIIKQIYCSNKCRVAAWRAKYKKEKE
jgi:hypothetical protein